MKNKSKSIPFFKPIAFKLLVKIVNTPYFPGIIMWVY